MWEIKKRSFCARVFVVTRGGLLFQRDRGGRGPGGLSDERAGERAGVRPVGVGHGRARGCFGGRGCVRALRAGRQEGEN